MHTDNLVAWTCEMAPAVLLASCPDLHPPSPPSPPPPTSRLPPSPLQLHTFRVGGACMETISHNLTLLQQHSQWDGLDMKLLKYQLIYNDSVPYEQDEATL